MTKRVLISLLALCALSSLPGCVQAKATIPPPPPATSTENPTESLQPTLHQSPTPLELLVQAQRDLVGQYSANGAPVYLVDVWQIYKDHPNAEKMYMDVVHPGRNSSQLIAEGWLEVFEENLR